MSTALAPEKPPVAPWGDAQTLDDVRPHVKDLLESSQAFGSLSPEEREQLARETVKVATYMANPDGLAREDIDKHGAPGLAEAQADATETARKRAASSPGFAGKDFEAGAVRQGVEQFGQLVQKVDFPAFVSGLIKGVFQAIVDSSIQQMRAYGELIANVAKTVDQYAQDNISENNARDFLAEKYPNDLDVTVNQDSGFAAGDAAPAPTPTLTVKSEDAPGFLQRVSNDFGLAKPVTDLSDAAQEQQLVYAAKLQIARGRQQLLASMVMLGINRIVVTDGLINAKVVFDMRARDVAAREAKASMYDQEKTSLAAHTDFNYDSWFSPVSAHTSIDARNDHVATVQSSLDETSTSEAEVKARLTGEVRVNFKSDYLPLEKMANPAMIASIQGNATPLDTTATVQRPAAGAPAAR